MFCTYLAVDKCASFNINGLNADAKNGTHTGLAIVTSFRFTCRTYVTSLTFITLGAGEFYVDVWRPLGNYDYRWIRSVLITSTTAGQVGGYN